MNKEAHVSDEKKLRVKELAEQMKRKTVMVVSVSGLPSAQFQDIKKKLRGKADVMVAKKSLVNFALEHCGIKELRDLVEYVDDSTAILFSDKDAFEISGILSDEKSPAKAKAGQIAPEDIEVKAGGTSLLPGPDISALSAVGLQPKVENGKIAIVNDKILVKKGGEISENQASIMAKLDIIPFAVGVDPIAAFDGEEKKVYVGIKIDKEKVVEELEEKFGRALPFAVEIGYVANETLDFILAKASLNENALAILVEEDVVEEVVEDGKVDEHPTGVPPGVTSSGEEASDGAKEEESLIEKVEDVVEEVVEDVKEVAGKVVDKIKEFVGGDDTEETKSESSGE